MERRKFIRNAALMAAGQGIITRSLVGKDLRRRPNILVITTDQQAAIAMSCAGNPYVKTPAMDRLARLGVRFEKAYCSGPICVPSRTSYMTGTMPHENGVDYNGEQVPFNTDAFPILAGNFLRAGYDTGHFGKWHIPADIHNTEWSGFGTAESVRNNRVDFDIVSPCLQFINKEREQPFLAFASFVNPHDICEFARILSGIPDELKNGQIPDLPDADELPPLPENWSPPEDEPTAMRDHYTHERTENVYPSRRWDGKDDLRWRQYLWGYYRMIELVDGYIGMLLDGLEASGQADRTVIVFASDHGDGMARHHWNQKTVFYDECARIPFIMCWPEAIPSGLVDANHLVNLGTDLFPTIMDAAGIAKPRHLKGLSALPSARGIAGAPEHRFVVSQNNLQPAYEERGEVSGRMVRTTRYKYVCYSNGEDPEQLFDMEEDPLETRNFAKHPAYADVLNEHRGLLRNWVDENDDFFRFKGVGSKGTPHP
ncbi:MAG: sulfatase-like hydrolase/transferase [Oceanipulchritudo sp.]